MRTAGTLRRAWDTLVTWAGRLFVLGLFGTAGLTAVTYTAIHHTAQPDFCNSCHIMEPYFASWQNSSHAQVGCIECHYEPGSVETLEGKFKALSQLAKYVTRTQGTKPWAEVSDASCMRSGCHSVRLLDGPVAFGQIDFDHRHHLLESRRGRRLRCTSCHTQVQQDEHLSVDKSVCYMCHFMPDAEGERVAELADCEKCHGAPEGELLVEGKAFDHAGYVARGVDCRECHDPVVEGDGKVRRERCHSCHGESGHIERLGETAFLHEMHVTEHKVDCFECHDQIHHGLLPVEPPKPTSKEGCGSCHESSHDAASKLYAGQGAVGVETAPSRMHQTRVTCDACHTGRTSTMSLVTSAHAHHGAHGRGTVASAGNIDCVHCHGTSYDGMLAEWQGAVAAQLERLEPALKQLKLELADKANPAAQELLADAERNYLLVSLDGSKGAHNVGYALDALRVAAERVESARGMLSLAGDVPATQGFPARSKDGCSACHAGIGLGVEISRAERAFPHGKHLARGMDCDACHSVAEHGQPAFPRAQCATCHHQESESFDANDCARCHGPQEAMLRGTLALLTEPKPGTMGEMECSECHGEAPAILRPKPQMCVLCHEAGYDELAGNWKREVDALVLRVEVALSDASGMTPEARAKARAALDAVRADGSNGAHNYELAKSILEDALGSLVSK